MKQNQATGFLKKMLEEQLYCLGRICGRYKVPDDAIWEAVKGFDFIYQKIKQEIEGNGSNGNKSQPSVPQPHPGIIYLLEKLEK